MRLSHLPSYVIRIMVSGVFLGCCVTNRLYFFFFFLLWFLVLPYILNFGPNPVCYVMPCVCSGIVRNLPKLHCLLPTYLCATINKQFTNELDTD